jgi:GLPGLI family protein
MKALVFIILSSFFLKAQSVEVGYNFTLIDEKDDFGVVSVEKLLLQTNMKESLLKRTAKDTVFESSTIGIFESGEGTGIFYEITEYKDLIKSIYYFKAPYFSTVVKDDRYKITWTIVPELKSILNYQCQKAICHFRGRDYVAYFASEIPISNGPFKFDGLPGLILEVTSMDNMVKIKANSIVFKNDILIKNPLKVEKTISWESFQQEYQKIFNRVTNYQTDLDSEIFIPNRAIEFYLQID